MKADIIIQIVAALCGTLGFGILFNMHGKKLLLASVGGMAAWGLYLLLHHWFHNEILCYFLVALIIAAYAEVMARVLKTPAITFCITALIPLVPGGALYYSISYALEGSSQEFLSKAAHTLGLAAALSVGIILVTAFTQVLTGRFRKKSQS